MSPHRPSIQLLVIGMSCALSGCAASQSRPGADMPNPPPTSAVDHRPNEIVTRATPAATLTVAERDELDYRRAFARGSADAVPGAQMALIQSEALSALNAVVYSTGQLPATADELVGKFMTWPLDTGGSPWPVAQAGSRTPTPRLLIGDERPPFTLSAESRPGGAHVTRCVEPRLSPEWEASHAAEMAATPERAAPASATPLVTVIAQIHSMTGSYPATPQDAFTAQRMALVGPAISGLRAIYPVLRYWKAPTGDAIGLTLGTETEVVYLLLHEPRRPGSMSVTWVDGATPERRDIQNAKLATMEPWANWEDVIGNVPVLTEAPTLATN